jgi:hypothetical protein
MTYMSLRWNCDAGVTPISMGFGHIELKHILPARPVPRQNLIRAECGAILSSRYSVKSLNLVKNCFEEREVLSGAGTSVRACSAYI